MYCTHTTHIHIYVYFVCMCCVRCWKLFPINYYQLNETRKSLSINSFIQSCFVKCRNNNFEFRLNRFNSSVSPKDNGLTRWQGRGCIDWSIISHQCLSDFMIIKGMLGKVEAARISKMCSLKFCFFVCVFLNTKTFISPPSFSN